MLRSSSADRDVVGEQPPRKRTRFVVRAAQRLGAWAGRWRGPLTVVGSLLAVGVLGFVVVGRWGQFARAATGAPWWELTVAAALQTASLVARSEAWNVCVHAAGGTVGRRRLYRAAGVGYLGNIVNGELGFAMRIASLRRAAPRETPKAVVLAATEVPIVLMEVTLATLTSFTLVAPLGLPWWTALVAFCAVLASVAGLARLARRHPSGWWRGLAALGEARARARIALFVVLAVSAQIARNWLMLHAVGIHASVFDATAVLIAVAVLGVLPVGPGVGAGAMVLILGSSGVAGVSAAGVLLTATGTLGALGYGAWGLTDRVWTARQTTAGRAAKTAHRASALTKPMRHARPSAPLSRVTQSQPGSPRVDRHALHRRLPRRARPVIVFLIFAGGVGIAAFALTRLDLSRSLHALTTVKAGFVALTFALMSVSLIVRAECWYVILRSALASTRISRLVAARATMIGVMVSATLPGRLGEPARIFVVARRAGDIRNCIGLVTGTAFAQTLLNVATVGALASLLVASVALFRDAGWAIGLATALPILAIVGILTGPGLLERAARRRTTVLGRAAAFVRHEIEQVRTGLSVFRRPRDAFHAVTAQLAAWSLQLLACYALLNAFGIATNARLGAAAAVLVATNIAAVVPVTPGNVGVFQAACVAVLAAYGVDAGRALAYGILLQLLEVATAITLGLPALLAEGLRPQDLRRASRNPDTPS